jgi:hypothetical protein
LAETEVLADIGILRTRLVCRNAFFLSQTVEDRCVSAAIDAIVLGLKSSFLFLR